LFVYELLEFPLLLYKAGTEEV